MKLVRHKLGLKVLDYSGSVVVIGDVHGHYKTLLALLKQLPENVLIVFVGDLIDRGPWSREIVELVKSKGYLCVLGNHEQMMIENAQEFKTTGKWKYWDVWFQGWVGGWDTLEGYRANDNDLDGNSLFEKDEFFEHVDWMVSLPIFIEFPQVKNGHNRHLVVSHSSAQKRWHERDKNGHEWMFAQDTLWSHMKKDLTRDPYLVSNPKKIENVYNVFGHTPITEGPLIGRHFAAIDNGVYSARGSGKGNLIAFQYPEGIVYKQEKVRTGKIDEEI